MTPSRDALSLALERRAALLAAEPACNGCGRVATDITFDGDRPPLTLCRRCSSLLAWSHLATVRGVA